MKLLRLREYNEVDQFPHHESMEYNHRSRKSYQGILQSKQHPCVATKSMTGYECRLVDAFLIHLNLSMVKIGFEHREFSCFPRRICARIHAQEGTAIRTSYCTQVSTLGAEPWEPVFLGNEHNAWYPLLSLSLGCTYLMHLLKLSSLAVAVAVLHTRESRVYKEHPVDPIGYHVFPQ